MNGNKLNSPASRLFVQMFIKADIKGNIKPNHLIIIIVQTYLKALKL